MRVVTSGLLLATTLFVTACAGPPRYQLLYRYEPPTDAAGRGCVTRCEQSRKFCLNECRMDYSACVHSIEPEAEARYAEALLRYEGALAQYRSDMDSYHLNMSIGWGDGWYGDGWYDHRWPYHGFYEPYYYPPLPPPAPSYADELGRLRAAQCDRDCGCQPDYDTCFLGCGGGKVPVQRCIAHCPPDS